MMAHGQCAFSLCVVSNWCGGLGGGNIAAAKLLCCSSVKLVASYMHVNQSHHIIGL